MKRENARWMKGLGAMALAAGALWALWAPGPVASADTVTEGCLRAFGEDMQPLGYCPLKHTDVDVDIAGFIARVTVTQQFANPYGVPIEAVYTFPMSDRAAVDSMTMTVGDRTIAGNIRRREEARRIYEQARAAGQAASLLDQERPNIFTQSVANIMPGEEVAITISYVEYLKYEEGEYEFSFPMVVGPRYNPAGSGVAGCLTPGADPVPDRARITPPVTPEGTRAGHDISLAVRLDAGVAVQNITSELHDIDLKNVSGSRAWLELKNKREIPNRDFVLKYAVAGNRIGDAVLAHAGAKGKFFTLILQPPDRVEPEAVTPKEMIFIIDRSGSMSGFPIEKAKKSMRMCIEQMNPDDTFNLISFSGGLGYCFERPVANTASNRRAALAYLDGLRGGGGTEMMAAIRAALENQNDPERLRVVCFMTDGFIGNDMAILDAIQRNAHTARVFSFGIGNGVNRFLLEGMAREGRGAVEIVTLESDGDAAAKRFHERIHSPLLTDITVDFGGLDITDVYPSPAGIPDLFASRPLILTGRYEDAGEGYITVRGRTAAGAFERRIHVELPDVQDEHDALAPLWARKSIDGLMAKDWLGVQQGRPEPGIKEAITQLGLDFGLVTQFTSFVAVEERIINEGGQLRRIEVPVEMTDGVSYEGVFGRGGRSAVAAGAVMKSHSRMASAPAAMPKRSARQSLGYLHEEAEVSAVAQPMHVADTAVSGRENAQADLRRFDVPQERNVSFSEVDALADDASFDGDEKKAPVNNELRKKLHKSLWNLESKLVKGNYREGNLKATNGWVEVFIRLDDDAQSNLDVLKGLGVRIIAHTRSSKTLLASVRVEDLAKVAKLTFVRLVEPPVY